MGLHWLTTMAGRTMAFLEKIPKTETSPRTDGRRRRRIDKS